MVSVDPLIRITDLRDEAFVSTTPTVLWKEHAQGVGQFSIDRRDTQGSIVVYVSCSPSSDFTVRQVDDTSQFMSGQCDSVFQNFGEFELAEPRDPHKFELILPDGVDRWVVVLAKKQRVKQ